MNSTVMLLIGVGLAAIPCGLAMLIYRPRFLATLALLAAFAAQTNVGAGSPVVSRMPILALLALAMKLAYDDRRSAETIAKTPNGLRLPLLMIVGFCAATIATSVRPLVSAQATIAVGALFAAGLGIARFVPVAGLLDSVGRISVTAVIGSLALSPVLPEAYLGQRLSGFFRNPNALGATAIVACATLPDRYLAPLGPPLVLATILSGSRGGGMGVAIVLLLRIPWSRLLIALAILIVPILAVGILSIDSSTDGTASTIPFSDNDGPPILRTRNNRSSQWSEGVADLQASWPLGQGFGASSFEYSNSGLFLLVEMGVLALPITGFVVALVAQAHRHPDPRVAALLLSLLVHSQFEGWMFAFGSAQAIVFWLIVVVAARERSTGTADMVNREPRRLRPSVVLDDAPGVGPSAPAAVGVGRD